LSGWWYGFYRYDGDLAQNEPEGVVTQTRRLSAEYKREAVVMLKASEVTVNRIVAEFGMMRSSGSDAS
jgi:hypothetical protein